MIIDKRKKLDGTEYYSFSYVNEDGKRIRLSVKDHPYFTTREAAQQWASSQEAFKQSQKDMINRKLEWKKTFYNFDELLKQYAIWQRERSPNAWKNNVFHLSDYAFPWFLNTKMASNVNSWHFLFSDFNHYLRREAKTIKGDRLIAVAFANKIITSLNTFINFLQQKNLIDPSAVVKCPAFPEHMQYQKSFDSVVQDVEYKVIKHKLEAINQDSADMFALLYATGMRIGEAVGLPMNSLFKGKFEGSFDKELRKAEVSYVGYIVLESQPCERGAIRDPKTHKIERKPLKGRKTISNKNNRIIPIRDTEVWNILARRYKKQKELLEAKTYGFDAVDYLLFDGLTNGKFTSDLVKAYSNVPFSPKSAHDLRHSFATLFTGETRSFYLAKLILGHNSKVFERYLHIFESLSLEAKKNNQEIDEIG